MDSSSMSALLRRFEQASQTHSFEVSHIPSGFLLEPSFAVPTGLGAAVADGFFEGFEEITDEDMDFPFSWLLGGHLEKPRGDPQLERDDGTLGDIRRLLKCQRYVGVHDSLKVALATSLIPAVHCSGKHRRVFI